MKMMSMALLVIASNVVFADSPFVIKIDGKDRPTVFSKQECGGVDFDSNRKLTKKEKRQITKAFLEQGKAYCLISACSNGCVPVRIFEP